MSFQTFLLVLSLVALICFLLLRSLRFFFQRLERDIALVTLNVSATPIFLAAIATVLYLYVSLSTSLTSSLNLWLGRSILAILIAILDYWILQLFRQVIVYYLKDYAASTEAMWDEVLIPLLEAVIPLIILLAGIATILQVSFGLDLAGAWLTLGGATFIIGFAVKDILSNFFSGIVLLIDSPFQFGDVLQIEGESGEQVALGVLRRIGIRVTSLYLFEEHTEVYIPNSVIQAKKITNLSRPITPVYASSVIEIVASADLAMAMQTLKSIVQAHPDVLGNIEIKLALLDSYYLSNQPGDRAELKRKTGRLRLATERSVNEKLSKIESNLEALTLTLNFLEKGGLSHEDIDTVQTEFRLILDLIGLIPVSTQPTNRHRYLSDRQPSERFLQLKEQTNGGENTLIGLVRAWYRVWLSDPDVVDEDQYMLPELWERKIQLLKRRVNWLYKKILNPRRDETRLDDYAQDLIRWLRERFKQARSDWQEPEVYVEQLLHTNSGFDYIRIRMSYYIDDIRLEDGARGVRVGSDILGEAIEHLKDQCITHKTENVPISSDEFEAK